MLLSRITGIGLSIFYSIADSPDRLRNKSTKAGAIDDDFETYGKNGLNRMNGSSMQKREMNGLDKYGIDIELDGSLRRSKKKKKQKKSKSKDEKESIRKENMRKEDMRKEIKDERSRLAFLLDNSNADTPVRIITTLVSKYGVTRHCPFEVAAGENVIARYRKGDFINVIRTDGKSGFVPVRICFLVAEEAPVATNEPSRNSPSIKSNTPDNDDDKDIDEDMRDSQVSIVTKDEAEVVNEAEKGATQMTNNNQEYDSEKKDQTKMNDYECDSLARKVRRHEIRQLLKRETGQKIFDGKNDLDAIHDVSQAAVTEHEHDNDSIREANVSNEQGNSTFVLQQKPIENGSNFSLNSIKKNEPENRTSSKLSLNSLQKETRNNSGSRHSLNSLKSKSIVNQKQNGNLQAKGNCTGSNQVLSSSQKLRFDNHSLNSYDGSLQEVYSRLNGDLTPDLDQRNGGFFYQRNNPPLFNESRVDELLNENRFTLNRRSNSLRGGASYAWLPQSHLNGFGHGFSPRLIEDERALKYLAESISAPGSRIVSPSHLYRENSQLQNEVSMVAEDSTMFAMRDFRAVEKDELSLRKGERVTLVKKDSEDWWWVVNNRGEEGLVPSYFLIPLLKPLQQGMGSLYDSKLSIHSLPFEAQSYIQKLELERIAQERQHRSNIEYNERPNGLIRSNTIGSAASGYKGSKIDWRKLYNNDVLKGHSRLKELAIGREGCNDVQSKEELLKRIRNDVMRDPTRDYIRKRSLSNESVHKINGKSPGVETRHMIEMIRNRELLDKNLSTRNDINSSMEVIRRDNHENINTASKQLSCKMELPSYEQCMNRVPRDQSDDGVNHKEAAFSAKESELFETPRVLRRRRTFSGGSSSRKMRFNANGTENEEKSKVAKNADVKENFDLDDGLSTWC